MKRFKATYLFTGTYYDGNTRHEGGPGTVPQIVDEVVAARLRKAVVVFTSTDPNGKAKPDPKPYFLLEEVGPEEENPLDDGEATEVADAPSQPAPVVARPRATAPPA